MDMPNIKAKEESIVDTEKALSFLKLKIYDIESLRSVLFKGKIIYLIIT